MEVGDLHFDKITVNGHSVWVLDESCNLKDIDHCLTCGSYALKEEFYKAHYCVHACYMSSSLYLSSPQWMEDQQQLNAPIKLFKQPALPSEPNPFRKGQMLEAIDPENQSLFCVVTVADVQGWRLQLHFEGFSPQFDFWVNCDSLDIFPAGWATENGHILQPPGDFTGKQFNWSSYLQRKGKELAPPEIFEINKELDWLEKEEVLGKKLEAVDIRANNLIICVATVTKVIGHRFLVHFDSWDNIYDYWTDFSSPFVFSVGYCEKQRINLTPPNGYEHFCWEVYLRETGGKAMPPHFFQPLPPVGFKRGMRIECVDLRNPRLIRPAVIQSTDGNMITVRYEGWPDIFDVKLNELSGDVHPVGYCETTGHRLEFVPKGSRVICPNLCEGRGNAVDSTQISHNAKNECPYLMDKERGERVVILVPASSDGCSSSEMHVLPAGSFSTSVNVRLSPNEVSPCSSSSSTRGSSNADLIQLKKGRRDDIFTKMMTLAQTVLQEERPREEDSFLFEHLLQEITPSTVQGWNVDETARFVSSLPNCENLALLLQEQLVDGDSLLLLSKDDLIRMTHGESTNWIKLFYALFIIRQKQKE